MAIAKVIYKESSSATGEVWMDVTQKTVTSATMLNNITALKNDGTNITGNIAFKNATNLTAFANTVTVQSGYYSSVVSKSIDDGDVWTPATTITANPTITVNTSTGLITATTSKATNITPSVTAGYVTQGYATAGTVSVSGSNTSQLQVQAAQTWTPTETAQTISSGRYLTGVQTIAAISSTYVGTGVPSGSISFTTSTGEFRANAGYYPAAKTYDVTTKAASTIYPSTTQQIIASGRYLTGAQTFAPVVTANLEASYIASGITVTVGDSSNASRIANVTGTLQGAESFAAIYKSLAYRSTIYSSSPLVSEWANSLSLISEYQFCGEPFYGSFIFPNVSYVGLYAFGRPYINQAQGGGNFTVSFPIPSSLQVGVFAYAGGLKKATFPNVSSIQQGAFYSCGISEVLSDDFPICTAIHYEAFRGCTALSKVEFPECISIGASAFYLCYNLSSISFPKCQSISYAAFSGCSKLTKLNFPECITISTSAFYSDYGITSISFPKCEIIAEGAFQGCSSLSQAIFPQCTEIFARAFSVCIRLTEASFPECLQIGSFAFDQCKSLTTISFPKCSIIQSYAFRSCHNLLEASFPECTTIPVGAFQFCSALNTAYFSKCSSIYNNAFQSCSSLTEASFPSCTFISGYAFSYCTKLESVYFMGSSVPSILANVFYLTPIQSSSYLGYFGSIYVPSSLVDSYKTATNWASYSSRIVGI